MLKATTANTNLGAMVGIRLRYVIWIPPPVVAASCYWCQRSWWKQTAGSFFRRRRFPKKKWLCSYTKIQITCLPTDQKPMIQSDKMYIHLTKFLENSSSEILAIIWNQDFPGQLRANFFYPPNTYSTPRLFG